MKKVLPLLAQAQNYSRLKSGRARGGEAVTMVENIRIYTDILNRHEGPYRPQDRVAEITTKNKNLLQQNLEGTLGNQ